MAREGLLELWTLLVAGACLYLCSIIIGQLSPGPSDLIQGAPEDPYVHRIRRTLDVKESARESLVSIQPAEVDVQPDGYIEKDVLHIKNLNGSLGANFKNYTQTNGQDSSKKVILDRYSLVINQPYLCHQVENDDVTTAAMTYTNDSVQGVDMSVYLLIIVHSHPAHKRRRNAIRETWGRIVHNFDDVRQVIIVFLLGIPQDYDEYQSVKKEARLYRDTVVYDFVDQYRNLSVKSLLGLQWSISHCKNAKFVIKADDDVYLNIPSFLKDLHNYPEKDLILGSLNPRSPVKRYGQWKVEYRDYPYSLFPPYCSGCTYAFSTDVARKLYHVSQSSQAPALIPVEDVYVTGLLAERAGIKCKHHGQFPTWITVPSVRYVQRFLDGEILGLHGVDWIRMHTMWQMIHKCPNCSTDSNQVHRWLSRLMDIDPMYR